MNEYEEQLRKVDRLKTIHHYADAIKEYGSLAEMALKQLHDGIYARLTPDEKLKLASVERQFGPKNPSETFTLGSWILFYQKSNLPDMLGKAHGIPASSIDVSGLSRIKEIRNKCVHNNYVGTPEESADAATLVEKLLLDFKLISTIPRNFVSPEPTGGDQEKDKVAELARKLRMVLSVEPLVEIGEAYFPDNDITINYWIEGKWEFIGSYLDENKTIHILLIQDSSHTNFHDDVSETAYEMLGEALMSRMEQTINDSREAIRSYGILVEISDGTPEAWSESFYSFGWDF